MLVFSLAAIRALAPAGFGLFVTLQAAALLGAACWDFGLAPLTTREVAAGRLNGWDILRQGIRRRAVTLIPALAVLLVSITPIGGLAALGTSSALLSIAYLLLFGSNQFVQSALTGLFKFRRNSIANMAGSAGVLGGVGLQVVLVPSGLGVANLMLALCAGEVATLVVAGSGLLGSIMSGAREGHDVPSTGALSFRRCIPFATSSFLSIGYNRLDVIVIAAIGSASAVGLYGPATRLQDAMYIIPGTAYTVIYPLFSRMLAEHDWDPARLRMMVAKVTIPTVVISLAAALAASIVAPIAIPLVLGHRYDGSVAPVQLIVWSVPAIAFNASLRAIVRAGHRAGVAAAADAAALATAILIDVMLVPRLGALGATAGATVREVPAALVLLWGASSCGLFRGLAVRHRRVSLSHVRTGGIRLLVLAGAVLIGAATARSNLGAMPPFTLAAALVGIVVVGCTFVLVRLVGGFNGATSIGALCAVLAVSTVGFSGVRVTAWATLGDVLLVLSAIMLLPVVVSARGNTFIPAWLVVALALLIAVGILTAILSNEPLADLGPAVQVPIAVLALAIGPGIYASTRARAALLAAVWVLSATVNGLVALSDSFAGSHLGLDLTGIDWSGRAAGLTTHPNTLGLVCAMALPMAVVMAVAARRKAQAILYTLAVLILILGVLISGSRAGLLAMGVGIAAIVLAEAPTLGKGRVVLFGGLVLVGLLSLLALLGPEAGTSVAFDRLTGQVSLGSSDAAHLENLNDAWLGFLSSPIFGTGFSSLRHADNVFLQTLQSGGVIALAGFLVLVGGALAQGRRVARGLAREDSARLLLVGAMGGMAAWLADGIVQNSIADRFLYIPFAFVLGLGLVRGHMTQAPAPALVRSAERTPAQRPNPVRQGVLP
jgi:O-antigen/teichoic acid export membrane protein